MPPALVFLGGGGGGVLRRRNARLATEAADLLARSLSTEQTAYQADAHAMVCVRLPWPAQVGVREALAIRQKLLGMAVDIPVSAIDGAAWVRVSTQAYNELSMFDCVVYILQKVISC